MAKHTVAGALAAKKTQSSFASELARRTVLTMEAAQRLVPEESDREELLELIRIVESDADDKAKRAQLEANIGKVSGAVLGVVKLLVA